MSPPAPRWVARAAAALLISPIALVVLAGPAAAHSVEGGELPAPPWLLAYGGAFLVLITAAALRTAWPRATRALSSDLARADGRVDRGHVPAPRVHAGHALGTALLVAVVVAAVAGPDSPAFNVAPRAVLIGWWVLLPMVVLLVGDVVARVNPFHLPVAALQAISGRSRGGDGRRGDETPSDWTAAAFLAAFSWYFLAYHAPGSPEALALALVVYAVAAVAGGLVWGRGWLATGEGFAGLSAAVARMSWRRSERRPVPGMAALMVVWLGGTAFDAVASTPWWDDVVGTARGWAATAFHTIGLVWLIAIVGGAYLLALRLAEGAGSGAREEPGLTPAVPLPRALGVALVPLATSWFVAHDLTLLLAEGQNLLVLLSDPLGRGWDLLGTGDMAIDFTIVEEPWVGWVQVAVLAAGHVAAVVLAHDVALQLLRRRAAMRVTWAIAVLAAASAVAAPLLVLG